MRRRPHGLIPMLLLALAVGGCGASAPRPDSGAGAGSTSPSAPASSLAPPAFSSEITPVTAAELGASWRAGCPVGPADLRALKLSYWGFDDQSHLGTIVVHRTVADEVVGVFATLYRERFPIRRLSPVSGYGGSDDRSMADDNSSGFNCREAVAGGPAKWSAHAYGQAIDVNPVENPYLVDGKVLPPAGAPYADRTTVDGPGLAVPDGTLVEAFASAGWQWGGEWSSAPDYQHFSKTGD
ncbi:M15 family metallopeptidase [Micromonospora sp. NPDC049523]|uniref:M15 family metallopeptidase n=1 Tax=Micromonospora sp. NPDC049523 TaxID=3155921 RepID=UPI0034274C6F